MIGEKGRELLDSAFKKHWCWLMLNYFFFIYFIVDRQADKSVKEVINSLLQSLTKSV